MDADVARPSPSPLRDAAAVPADRALNARYRAVRRASEEICAPLEQEDYVIQSMPDASPTRWHLAHTTWFFETFVLTRYLPDYRPYHPLFGFLFNSYYETIGPRWSRPQRGLLSRPTVAEIYRYRAYVDEGMAELFQPARAALLESAADAITLGLHHEQQHQELIFTDLKHAWSFNPLHPVYRPAVAQSASASTLRWLEFPEQLAWIGHDGNGFAFDNEAPRHRTFLHGFRLANRLVTNAEFEAFIDDGGYRRAELWLSDGWALCQSRQWQAPLYWDKDGNQRVIFTLAGCRPLEPHEPVCHVSYFEADAYARWAGARLPAEAEWETAAALVPVAGHFLEAEHFHPAARSAADDRGPLFQMYGDVWQWTASPYVGYPGYRPLSGALGEYNGKFMCNQLVLRGASCVTPRTHARRTYRNFFPPDARWQFSGIRLAQDLS